MIEGVITADREAVVYLTLYGSTGQEEEIEAVIDTGFNDVLTLPSHLVSQLGLAFAAPTRATLADGSIVRLDYYQATILWNGQVRNILAWEADGSPLVGMSLL
ncbi:MAG TPA: hypothetical protein VFB21_23340 [Chthonomonadaceae bacterium]|nr:hypothetical protein [Chthonomonadaceae bacterium]